jgi:hypothetical protein
VGLTLESHSFDLLVYRVKQALPEMLELNKGYTGPIRVSFITDLQVDLETTVA